MHDCSELDNLSSLKFETHSEKQLLVMPIISLNMTPYIIYSSLGLPIPLPLPPNPDILQTR